MTLSSDLHSLAKSFLKVKKNMDEVKKLHNEVLLGTRRPDCLSCGEEARANKITKSNTKKQRRFGPMRI